MSYATGSASTVDALMTAALAFAVSNAGMTETINRTETIAAETWEVRCLSKSGQHWWFRWKVNDAYGMPATNSTGASWAAVTGRPVDDSRWYPITAPFVAYHLFTEGSVVHVAAEQSNGAWQHFNFGSITKYGTWTGGHYVGMTAMAWSNPSFPGVNAPIDGTASPNYSACGFNIMANATNVPNGMGFIYAPYESKNYASCAAGPADAGYNKLWAYGLMDPNVFGTGYIQRNMLNNFNGRTSGLRLEVLMRDPDSGLYQPMGYIPNLRLIDVTNLNGGDVINTDWRVFPLNKKGSLGTYLQYMATGGLGWAVRAP